MHEQRVRTVLLDLDPERADRGDRRLGVRGAPETRDAGLVVADRPEQDARGGRSTCRPGRRCARRAARRARSRRRSLLEHRRGHDAVALASRSRTARSASPSPETSTVSVPPRSLETWSISKSSTLIRSAPSAWKMPASTPGRSGMWMRSRCRVPGSAKAVSSSRRRCALASPIQRARNPASPSASAGSTCSRARRCSASASPSASRLSRKMSTQIRGFAPAIRVMSRREPPAAWSGSWPSIRVEPAWLRSTFASTCGRWLVSADEPVVRVRPDRDGSRAERADEAVEQPQPLRRRRGRRGKEPRRAVEELRRGAAGAARLGAADRVAADEPRVRRGRRADRALRRADVGDRALPRGPVKDFSHGVREIADRRSDDDEIRVRDGCGEVAAGARRRAHLRAERFGVRVPARHVADAGAARGETGGCPNQPRPDDGRPRPARLTLD